MSDENSSIRMPNLRGQFTLFSEQSDQQPMPLLLNAEQLEAAAAVAAAAAASLPPLQPLSIQPLQSIQTISVQPVQPINFHLNLGAVPKTSNSLLNYGRATLQKLKECNSCCRTTAVAQCIECRDYMCQTCVQLHARVPFAQEHHVRYLDDITNKVMSLKDVASHTLPLPSWPPNEMAATGNVFETSDLLNTISKMDRLCIAERKSEDAAGNPTSSRVVGAGRHSFSSSQSPSNSNTSGLSGTSMESLQIISRGRTPIDRTSESDTPTLNIRAPPAPAMSSTPLSDLPSLLSASMYSNPSTSCSISPPSAQELPGTPTYYNQAARGRDGITPTELFALWSSSNAAPMALIPAPRVDPAVEFASRCPPCIRHDGIFVYFCNTCLVPACLTCRDYEHPNHNVIHMLEAIRNVKLTADQIAEQMLQIAENVRLHTNRMQRVMEDVDIKAQFASANVRHSFQNYIGMLDNRETQLLIRVEQARISKIQSIRVQMDTMQFYYNRLLHNHDVLMQYQKCVSAFELIIINNKSFRELTQARNVTRYLMSLPLSFHDNTYFLYPSNAPLVSLGTSLAPYNAVKLYRDNADLPMLEQDLFFLIAMNPKQLSTLRCRPIFGTREMVTIKHFGSTPTRLWCAPGKAQGELCRPWGVTSNRHGEIIVADRSNNRIQVFNVSGDFLFEFGEHGSEPGQFHKCAGIAVGPHDEIVVADKDNHRIQVFSRNGDFILTFGCEGELPGQFRFPWDVAVDTFGNILVSDTRNHRIQLFGPNGKFLAKWGGEKESKATRLFDSPRGVTFDPRGNILVTDFNLHKVVMIERPSGRVRSIGREGKETGNFSRPQGLCCDDRGWFVVVDSKNHRYQVFNENGEFLWMVGRQGKPDPGNFDRPSDVCLDAEGHVIVVDSDNHRIQKF